MGSISACLGADLSGSRKWAKGRGRKELDASAGTVKGV